ncbi:MAG: extracellular solute-binding protein [Clostridiales bacterium]|nr:extracellular solute-binding protein [Clostridiales bacterium]
MKRAFAWFVALMMALTAAAAMAGGALPLVAEPTTLTALVQPTAKIIDINTNDMTLWLEEQTGVHIEWTVIESDARETVSLMLNSGEALPDILMVNLTYDQQYLYGQQGILLPLADLIKENAPRIVKAYADYPLYAATSTRPDGNIYYITAYEECFHCTGAQKMWVNQKWLDNLGLPQPATTQEFEDMLIAFRDGDANGNGDPDDEVPMSGIYNTWHWSIEAFLMCAFIYDDGGDRYVVNDGTVSATYVADAFREGLRYINGLFEEGLIDENAFVQDRSTFLALTTGEDVLVGAVPMGHTAIFCNIDSPAIFEYQALTPLVGPEGVQLCGYYPNVAKTGDGLALSAGCKDPALAIRWTDFLFSEEATIRSQYGVKDRDWTYNDDPAILGLNDEQALFHTFGKAPVYVSTQMNEAWEHTSPFQWVDYIFAGQAVLGGEGYDLEKVLYDATKRYTPYFPKEFASNLSFDTDDASYIAGVKAPINDFVNQSIAEYIIGTRDIDNDADWDDYKATLEAMDLTNYIATVQRGYDQQQAIIKNLQ